MESSHRNSAPDTTDQRESAEEADHDLSDEQVRRAEAHRGFVREMNDRLNQSYGKGGGVVLMALVVLVIVAVATGWWNRLTLWIPGLTGVLVVLFVVRRHIYSRRDGMRRRVEEYCQANGVSVDTLLEYYDAQQMYPFFSGMFKEPPGRLPEGADGEH